MKRQIRLIIQIVGISLVLHWCEDAMFDTDPEISIAIRKLRHWIQNRERRSA